MYQRKNINTKSDIRSQTILRQNHEIEKLRRKISELEVNANERNELSESIDNLHNEWIEIITELEEKRNEYNHLMSDLYMIKNVMNDIGTKISWYKKSKN